MILCGVLPLCLSPWILIKPRIAGEIATSNMQQNATWLLNLDSTWFLSKELHRIVLVDPHLHKAPDVSLKITPFEALENDGYRPNKAYTLPVSTVQVITYDYPWFPNMTGVTSIHCPGSSLGTLRVAGGNCPTAEAAGGGLFRSWGPMAKLAAGEGNGKRRFFRIPFRNPSGNIPFISHWLYDMTFDDFCHPSFCGDNDDNGDNVAWRFDWYEFLVRLRGWWEHGRNHWDIQRSAWTSEVSMQVVSRHG